MKILVIDNHVLIREALRGVLTELRADVAIIDHPIRTEVKKLSATMMKRARALSRCTVSASPSASVMSCLAAVPN